MGHFQGPRQRDLSGGIGLGVPGGTEDLDDLVQRLQPRLVPRPRAVHEPCDVARQPQRPRRGASVAGRSWDRRSRRPASRARRGRPARPCRRPRSARFRRRLAGRLVAPGRVAVGLGQAVMGRDVLGIDGQRAAVGGDRLLEIIPPLGARDRQLDPCPGVERGSRAR